MQENVEYASEWLNDSMLQELIETLQDHQISAVPSNDELTDDIIDELADIATELSIIWKERGWVSNGYDYVKMTCSDMIKSGFTFIKTNI